MELRVPRLTAAQLRQQVDALLTAREEVLARRDHLSIVRTVDAVARRLLDRGDPLRTTAERVLPRATGSSLPMISHVLDRMAVDWTEARLLPLLRAEFGDARVLDSFRPRPGLPGVEARALGPRLTTHVFSGNVPGVAVTSLVRALLVKSASLGKSAVGEPLLAALFARALAEVDPELGRCIAVTYWRGGEGELERVAVERAEAVVVYGGAQAVEAVRSITPAGARFLGYGHRLSFGVVAREALAGGEAAALAARAAQDVATFDQQGCVSPHLFFVEEGGEVSPGEWAGLLAGEMARVERELPRGTLSPGEASAIRQLRGEMEFAAIAGRGVALHASPAGTAWTVILDPEPGFAASCLNRTVRVKPVRDVAEAVEQARPLGAVLQTVGLAGGAERLEPLTDALAALGASRLTTIGKMAWPAAHWLHDGRPPLGDLVRWSEREIRDAPPSS